ncbi:fimbrillin family protein, partial [uncultured Bacteroides sp.]
KEFTKNGIWEIGKQYTYSINSTGIVITPVIELKVNRDNTLYPNGGYKGTWSAGNPHPNSPSLYIEMTDEEKQAYLPVSGVLNDVSIAAYMKVAQANAESAAAKKQIRKLDFTIEWSIDGGTTWNSSKESPELGWKPATGSQSRADDTDPTQPVSGSIILPAQSQFTYMRNFLYGKGTTIEGQTPGKTITDAGNGSKDAPYDLVDRNEVAQESANCYIVNDHGYYKFPTYYGNTYNKESDTSSYKYKGDIDTISDATRKFVLKEFVKHDDNPVTSGEISGIEDAILLWQDSPDLVTEVKYDNGWVSFHVPEESINQGNAVIAVRGSEGILWNWHIWVTHRKWDKSSCHTMSDDNLNQYDKPFIIAPCNLGYCEPHVEDVERNMLIRFVANGEQVGDNEIALTVSGASQPGKDEKKGIITFTQPEIAASAAGDNTYYQWGRKDPMLPGIHNDDTYNTNKELDMVNKMFYSTEQYRFTSSESARSIGESIRFPYQFFMHQRPLSDDATEQNKIDNYKRRHWHDGRNASYGNRTIMNYWNTQLTTSGYANFIYGKEVQYYKQSPNNLYVIKTIYDPSPAGFKIPPIKAFADFFDTVELKEADKKTVSERPNVTESTRFNGWTIQINDQDFYFPATGVRDMGVKEQEVNYGTFPGFSSITYIATSGFHGKYTGDDNANSSCLILSIDRRDGDFKNCTKPIEGTNNAYGFTVRPIRDGQKN